MIARWFWREWRSPSLLIVWLALSLAVACVLALGSISDRMEKGLSQQSREFMAGDRTLRSSREVPAEWIAQARKSGLTVGEQLSFATMTFAGDTPQLADVKAVDDRYPLYGTLETQPPGLKPQAGSVLLAPRLMALLNLKTGDTIDVGDATLRIAGEVIQEPDAGFNPFQMAPRLMMNMDDVAKTGAVQPGSRVAWRYKFAGDAEQLANYEQFLSSDIPCVIYSTRTEPDEDMIELAKKYHKPLLSLPWSMRRVPYSRQGYRPQKRAHLSLCTASRQSPFSPLTGRKRGTVGLHPGYRCDRSS